jgi:hypothetical protein
MKKNLRSFLFFVLIFSGPFFAVGFAEEKPGADQLMNQLEEVKTRIENIEKQQQEIVAKDNDILEKLDQLRIWVHRK